ncbi:FAD:protein FMN transferase [Lentilitoribacter sp. Alg239-R112]|uniref:FAD:protein FMN transferase n=1 Tax=Lentilitoribacter sp. Alg239-R112 TaxID=2305987 RepID=UPI0013A6DF71|nr:FAD:protein FMN transferase [Lentilitoribacter sp. Alg239-R112]
MSKTMQRFEVDGSTMGTRFSAIFVAPENTDVEKIISALQYAVDRVDNQMSTWKPNSDLMRVNRTPINTWVDIPRELAVVLNEALYIGKLTKGAFNIGVGKLVDDWGFGPNQKVNSDLVKNIFEILPAHEILELDLDQFKLRKHAPIDIDLCGIAKGFGVDEMARVLLEFNIENFLVSIDGELKASGLTLNNEPWSIGIEKPDYNLRDTALTIEVTNIALATSGNYRHFKHVGETTISHSIDTKKGRPVQNNIASVTVALDHGISADAWATAFLVIGREKAIKLANELQIDILISEKTDNVISSFATGKFQSLIDNVS